jgi:hypothetical protein
LWGADKGKIKSEVTELEINSTESFVKFKGGGRTALRRRGNTLSYAWSKSSKGSLKLDEGGRSVEFIERATDPKDGPILSSSGTLFRIH